MTTMSFSSGDTREILLLPAITYSYRDSYPYVTALFCVGIPALFINPRAHVYPPVLR